MKTKFTVFAIAWILGISLTLISAYGQIRKPTSSATPNTTLGVIDLSTLIAPGVDCGQTIMNVAKAYPGYMLQFPPGEFITTIPLDFSPYPSCRLRGAGRFMPGGSRIKGAFPDAVIKRVSTGTGNIELFDLNVANTDPAGECVHFEAVYGLTMERINTKGNRHITIASQTNTEMAMRDILLDGNLAQFPQGIGLAVRGHLTIDNIGGFQLDRACQLSGMIKLAGGRFEINNTAIITGIQPDGTGWPCQGSISCSTFEANLTSIWATKNTTAAHFTSLLIDGHDRSANGQVLPCQFGIDSQAQSSKFSLCSSGGSFATAAFQLNSPQNSNNLFQQCSAGNKFPGRPPVQYNQQDTSTQITQCTGF
jgi:hypothetical protein